MARKDMEKDGAQPQSEGKMEDGSAAEDVAQPRSFGPVLDAEPKVTATVPQAYGLMLPHSVHPVKIEPGVQELPQSIAEHPYSKANGVKVYKKGD